MWEVAYRIGDGWLAEWSTYCFTSGRTNLWSIITYYVLEISYSCCTRGDNFIYPLIQLSSKYSSNNSVFDAFLKCCPTLFSYELNSSGDNCTWTAKVFSLRPTSIISFLSGNHIAFRNTTAYQISTCIYFIMSNLKMIYITYE